MLVVVWEYRASPDRLEGLSDRGRRLYHRETEIGRFDFLE